MGKAWRVRNSESRWRRLLRRLMKTCCCCFVSSADDSATDREVSYTFQNGLRTEGDVVPIVDILLASAPVVRNAEPSDVQNDKIDSNLDTGGSDQTKVRTSPAIIKKPIKRLASPMASPPMKKRVAFDLPHDHERETTELVTIHPPQNDAVTKRFTFDLPPPVKAPRRPTSLPTSPSLKRGVFWGAPRRYSFSNDGNEGGLYLQLNARDLVSTCIFGATQTLTQKSDDFARKEAEKREKYVTEKDRIISEMDSIVAQAKSIVHLAICNAIEIFQRELQGE